MPSNIITLIGQLITALIFFGMALYAAIRQKDLQRTTRNSSFMFYLLIGLSLALAVINLALVNNKIFRVPQTYLLDRIDLIVAFSSILMESLIILLLFTNKIMILARANPGRVLAIGAHPDDIEIAVGATLSKMHDAGYQISGLIMTYGEKGGNGGIRPNEAIAGGDFVGLDEVEILHFSDAHLSDDAAMLTEAIESMIEKTLPDIIFTHSIHDLHQDHQAVYYATIRAARAKQLTILCYESPSATQDFHPTYYIDVGKYVNVKIHAIKKHWDQKKKRYTKPDLVRGKMAFRGGQVNVDYAEGFEVVRMLSQI